MGVFNPPETEEGEAGEEEEEEGEEKKVEEVTDLLKSEVYKYVPEVVKEEKIHFYKVPRLGCFMAIPLLYQSCMNEAAYDTALEDYLEVSKQMEEINKKREEWKSNVDADRDDAQKNGTDFPEPDMPEDIRDDILTQPYTCGEKKYIVCLDTLGQDR